MSPRGARREDQGGWRGGQAGPQALSGQLDLAAVGQCPANQAYRECGETCVRTCSKPAAQLLQLLHLRLLRTEGEG